MTNFVRAYLQVRQQKSSGWTQEQREAARRRLTIVTSDPGMTLPALVTEIAQHAGADTLEAEQQIRSSFTSIVSPGSTVYRSIRLSLVTVLSAVVLNGPQQVTQVGCGGRQFFAWACRHLQPC